jgi:hypothetical protein
MIFQLLMCVFVGKCGREMFCVFGLYSVMHANGTRG